MCFPLAYVSTPQQHCKQQCTETDMPVEKAFGTGDGRRTERAIREVKHSRQGDRVVGGGVMACLQLNIGCVCPEGSAAPHPRGNVQE